MCDTPIARTTGCESSLDLGHRSTTPLATTQCSYQGQQGDATRSQSVRGNYKTRFLGGQNRTAVEGNASVHQVNPVPVSRTCVCVCSSH